MTNNNALFDMYMSQYGVGGMQAPFKFQVATPGSQPINYPMSNIESPGINDVMCGRGGATNNHIGNIRFRQLVNEHKLRYLAAPKSDKPKVAGELVQIWRSLLPPGRFLARSDPDMGDDSLWHDIGDKKARQKCSQSLRERTPDVIPFVHQLQQKQKEEEEKRKLEHQQQIESSNINNPLGAVVDAISNSSGHQVHATTISSGSSTSDTNGYQNGYDSTPDQHTAQMSGMSIQTTIPEMPVSSNLVNAQQNGVGGDDDGYYVPCGRGHTCGTSGGGVSSSAPISNDAYLEQVDDFLENAPEGDRDTFSVADYSMAFSTHSWIRSVQSVDSGAMMSLGESALVDDHHDDNDDNDAGVPTAVGAGATDAEAGEGKNNVNSSGYTPPLPLVPSSIRPAMPSRMQSATRSQKMNMAAAVNFSLLSDLTDRSAQRSMRSAKMSAAGQLTSNFSMRSETTDISAAMKALVAEPTTAPPAQTLMRQQVSLRSAFQLHESTGNISKLSMMSGLTDLSEGLNSMDLRKK